MASLVKKEKSAWLSVKELAAIKQEKRAKRRKSARRAKKRSGR